MTGTRLGLIGFGRIAQAVARRARRGFGMRILIYMRSAVGPALLKVYAARQCSDLRELLAESDLVSLYCPSTPGARHLIDGAALAGMQQSAIL